MRFLLVVLAGLTLASGAGAAEEQKATPGAGGEPSARQMALSRRYVELMQGDQLEQLIQASIEAGASSEAGFQEMAEEDRQFTLELASDVMSDMLPQMLDRLVPVYARTFTEGELEALIAFYDSELGRSVIAKTISSMPEADEAMMAVMPQVMEKMAARICARYGCEPGDREAITGGATTAAPSRRK